MLPRSLLRALLVCLAGLTCSVLQDAGAGVTIDVLFQDATSPSGITISAGDAGPGCTFSGYYSGSVTNGYCMDVIMTTTWNFTEVSVSVAYDSDHGLAVASMTEWTGLWLNIKDGRTAICSPADGLVDNGGLIQRFDCIDPPPAGDLRALPGTYRLGTIVWDTSATTPGTGVIRALIADGDGVTAVVNGNVVDVSASVVLRSHILTIIPEPGTAALLGLGLVGLLLAARRRRLQ